MKKILFFVSFSMLFFSALSCHARDFYIELIPEKKTVKRDEIFAVTPVIMNMETTPQKFCFWTCSYNTNWQLLDPSDSLEFYGQDCPNDFISCITLLPFQRLDQELYLKVKGEAQKGKVNFRIVFTSCINKEECLADMSEEQEKFASQPAEITIK